MTFISSDQRKAVFARLFGKGSRRGPSRDAVLYSAQQTYPKGYLSGKKFLVVHGGPSGASDYASVKRVMGHEFMRKSRREELGPGARQHRVVQLRKAAHSVELAHELGHLRPRNLSGITDLIQKKAPILSPAEILLEETLATFKGAGIYKRAGGSYTKYYKKILPAQATYWKAFPSDTLQAIRDRKRK